MSRTRNLTSISMPQLTQILREVYTNHEWVFSGRKIKYVDFHFDNRTGDVFTIEFRTIHGDFTFSVVNRPGLDDIDLFKEVWDWLESGRASHKHKDVRNLSPDNTPENDGQFGG